MTYLLVNLALDDRDPRLAALRWLSEAQLDRMQSLIVVAYRQHRTGGRR